VIQFLLNDTPVKIEKFAPNLNILEWIRTTASLTGTKEGCSTGDCGACTLLVGEENNGQWHYKTVNSCLMLLGNAHAKHIITIEFLTSTKIPALSDLHPVQKALVESHASQCGFCTPGFVMSLLALYINNKSYPGKKAVIHALGGNLCRCTGYRPILDAAQKCFEYPRQEEQWSALAKSFKSSITTDSENIPSLVSHKLRFFLPQNISDLLSLKYQYPNAKLVAGGTDLSIEFSQQFLKTKRLISVAQVNELKTFVEQDDHFEIGAALPYSDFTKQFCHHFPESKELFERLGSTQIRNTGTLGGSIGNASPIGDPAPLLIALNAQIELISLKKKRVIALEDFFINYKKTMLRPKEVISKIIVPKRSAMMKLACHKVSKRIEDDISAICLVVAVETQHNIITKSRCALGGMAAIPARALHIEKQLLGAIYNQESFIKAGRAVNEDFSPLSDVRASAEYRIMTTENLMSRIGYELCQPVNKPTQALPIRIYHAAL
jgi:xanthine dehydrogenase small subunit